MPIEILYSEHIEEELDQLCCDHRFEPVMHDPAGRFLCRCGAIKKYFLVGKLKADFREFVEGP